MLSFARVEDDTAILQAKALVKSSKTGVLESALLAVAAAGWSEMNGWTLVLERCCCYFNSSHAWLVEILSGEAVVSFMSRACCVMEREIEVLFRSEAQLPVSILRAACLDLDGDPSLGACVNVSIDG